LLNTIFVFVFGFLFFAAFSSGASAGTATLNWSANNEPDLAGYRVYYGTSARTSSCPTGGYANNVTVGATTTHIFNTLTDGQTYYFSVTAYDTTGNESCFSGEVSKVIPAPDTTAPTAPSGLSATAVSSSQINLTWNASTDSVGVIGYRVFRGGSQIATSSTASYSNSGLSAATAYTYTVYAYDAANNQSATSAPASATTQGAASGDGGGGRSGGGSSGGAGGTNQGSSQATTTATSTASTANTATTTPTTISGQTTATSGSGAENSLAGEATFTYSRDQFISLTEANKTLYLKIISLGDGKLNDQAKKALALFIQEGTGSTRVLGAGERAGAVGSYFAAFGALPKDKASWIDVIKIGNGRWPGQTSAKAEAAAEKIFKTIYLRAPKRKENKYDNNAVSVIAYGLRPAKRNLNSEKAAIKSFKYIFKRAPSKANDWDVVRAIAYSGAKR
jgi:hypothetical protein